RRKLNASTVLFVYPDQHAPFVPIQAMQRVRDDEAAVRLRAGRGRLVVPPVPAGGPAEMARRASRGGRRQASRGRSAPPRRAASVHPRVPGAPRGADAGGEVEAPAPDVLGERRADASAGGDAPPVRPPLVGTLNRTPTRPGSPGRDSLHFPGA